MSFTTEGAATFPAAWRNARVNLGGTRVTEKTATKSAKRTTKPSSARPAKRRRKPSHEEISTRAYYIHIDEGRADELGNWLRAEEELTKAA
jgi:hypothetical protein